MHAVVPRREQEFDLLPEQIGSRVPKQCFGPSVDEEDIAASIHDDNCIGRRFKHRPEFLLGLVALVHRRAEFITAALALRKLFSGGAAHCKNGECRQHDDESEPGKIDKEKPNIGRYGIRCPKRDQLPLLVYQADRRNANSCHEIEAHACVHKGQGCRMVSRSSANLRAINGSISASARCCAGLLATATFMPATAAALALILSL